jgi:hypothetical protein
VLDVYRQNTGNDVPPIPPNAEIFRIHVSGDFDSPEYIQNWITRVKEETEVAFWAYTRSWRVKTLLPRLEVLRALPNMQLFASLDPSCEELPPVGWRRAWIWRDAPKNNWPMELRLAWPTAGYHSPAHKDRGDAQNGFCTKDSTPGYVCPEETGRKKDCLSCGYCFEGQKHDVIFLEH